jgi:hypothetical protein
MSKYPEWAPPELVQRAESKPECDPLLEKLIIDANMEKVWENLYQNSMRDSEQHEDGRFASLLRVMPGDVVGFHKMNFPKTPIGLYQLVKHISEWREEGTLLSKNELDSGVEEIRAVSEKLKALIKEYRLDIRYKGDFIKYFDDDGNEQLFEYSEPEIVKQLDEYVEAITNMRDDFMVSPARADGGSAFYAVLFSEAITQTYSSLDKTAVRRIVADLINVLLGTSFNIEDIRKKLWNHTQKMRNR